MTAKEIFFCLGYHEKKGSSGSCVIAYEKEVFHFDQMEAELGEGKPEDWRNHAILRNISFEDHCGIKKVYCYDSDKYKRVTENYTEYPMSLNPLEIKAISMQLDELGWSLKEISNSMGDNGEL